MSANTKIEWCDHTFNPWIGCTKISPGCDRCYAEVSTPSRTMKVLWGAGQQRQRTSPGNWNMPLRWNAQADAFAALHGRRQRVFCASLADVFDNAVDREWRDDLATLILNTPALDWLLLTKRIGNAGEMLDQMFMDGPPDSVWVGATIVNQGEADRDIPKLLRVPARIRFLSMEPLLGPVDLETIYNTDFGEGQPYLHPLIGRVSDGRGDGCGAPSVDWVIAGGESGPGARPTHPAWFRLLRDQCAAAGVPFHLKQWGEWTPGENVDRTRGIVQTAFLEDDGWHIYSEHLATAGGHIDDEPDLYRVGKKAAGRLLDGTLHDGFPS